MGLETYTTRNDHFEEEESGGSGYAFPCCACKHRHGTDMEEPCRTCGHNSNAIEEPAK